MRSDLLKKTGKWRWIIMLALIPIYMSAQVDTTSKVGLVSYTTPNNVYVRLGHSDGVEEGDTLYVQDGKSFIAALRVNNTSSISSVCETLINREFSKDDQVFHLTFKISKVREEEVVQEPADPEIERDPEIAAIDSVIADSVKEASVFKEKIRGRLAASAHTNFNDGEVSDANVRMRYTFSLRGTHLRNSPVSVDAYLSYRHNTGPNTESNIGRRNAFRMYSLAASYDIKQHTKLTAGRRINRNLANVGAIDGFQAEHFMGDFTVGAVAGSRPDIFDYGLNLSLFEYGGYVAHHKEFKNGYSQSSLAFFEQRNSGNIDRRFTYFQHNSMPFKNLSLFASFEVDWYKRVADVVDLSPRISSMYVSGRYRFNRKLSLFASFDNRRNIIYYETFQSQVEQLLENATRQGVRLRLNYRPFRFVTIGLTGGYRHQKDNPNDSKNAYGYINFTRLPVIKGSLSLSTNWLETVFLTGEIYSARYNRDIIKGKLSGSFQFRYINYAYTSYDLNQQVYTASLHWRVLRSLSLSTMYEGTFNERNQYHRVHVNLVQRF